jgi:hypothetical protein
MHKVGDRQFARIKSNERAMAHFSEYEKTFRRYAKDVLDLAEKYPRFKNEETRVDLIKWWILEFDPSIWGLKTDIIPSEEIAETYARMVLGHEE